MLRKERNGLNHEATWAQKTAFEAAVALQNRSLTAQAYLADCLEQIEARESEVNFFEFLSTHETLD